MIIRFTEMNTGGRKGLHIYIKDKGKRGKYYKYEEGIPVDIYAEYYKNSERGEKGTIQAYKKQYKRAMEGGEIEAEKINKHAYKYLKEIRKRGTMQEKIRKGISTARINNALKTNRKLIEAKKRELLENLVIDKQLRGILVKEHNFQKIKYRLEHRIEIKNERGETIGTTGTFNKTIEEVVSDIKKVMQEGEEVIDTETPRLARKIKNIGYSNYEHRKNGRIGKVQVTTIFRKGK